MKSPETSSHVPHDDVFDDGTDGTLLTVMDFRNDDLVTERALWNLLEPSVMTRHSFPGSVFVNAVDPLDGYVKLRHQRRQ